ncbi:MAG: carboxylesterase/lipase family protein [bacterium]|nr:carboxylesterase/lipase family protein [bacterium]
MNRAVETQYGKIRGSEATGIRSFKGVRFARAPTGPYRFRPPAPPEPWTGVQDATEHGPAAPQYALPWFGWISAAGVPSGDDCLSLNLWTPGLDGARRPVMVWIHGGGFMVGSGSTGIYDGHDLARRTDVVVVSLNYRLGPLGYAHLGSVLGEGFEESTNLGVRDQIAALEWVRDHIEHFGGDPGNITVFGQSAGAMSIGALLGAPRARKLFQKAICMSGAADHVIERDVAQEVADSFLRALGGPVPTPDALGRIATSDILRAQASVMAEMSNMKQMMVFLPMVDGDVIPEQPNAAIRAGATADIPLLVGTTLDEWRLFRLIDPGPRGLDEAGLAERLGEALECFPAAPSVREATQLLRDTLRSRIDARIPSEVWTAFQSARVMHFPATRLADAQVAGGGMAHNYLFAWRPPALRRALGACHGLDIPFVFGAVTNPLVLSLAGFSPAAIRLSRKMQRAWSSFARHGMPGHSQLPAWTCYEPSRRNTMVFGRRCELSPEPLESERNLLESWSGQTPPDAAAREVG